MDQHDPTEADDLDVESGLELPGGFSRRRAMGLGAAAAGLAVAGAALPALPAMAATKKKPKPKPKPPAPIGIIQANRMNLAMGFFEGVTLPILNLGVGHWPGTPIPGRIGNGVYPGHRVSHHRAFLNIDKMQIGDNVDFHVFADSATYRYKVTGAEIVDPKRDAARILNQTAAITVTLFGCHPPHSTKFRYVVHAAFDHQLVVGEV
jgi:sortase A